MPFIGDVFFLSYSDAENVAHNVRILNPKAASPLDECDQDKLESALAAPQAGFGDVDKYLTIAEKASALLYAVAKGHCCPNGNKRLAYVLAVTFLIRNGQFLWADPDEMRLKVEEVAASHAGDADAIRAALAAWILERMMPQVEAQVRLQAGELPGGQT